MGTSVRVEDHRRDRDWKRRNDGDMSLWSRVLELSNASAMIDGKGVLCNDAQLKQDYGKFPVQTIYPRIF